MIHDSECRDTLTRWRWFSYQGVTGRRMNDLSMWNYAIDFTAREAAALIVAEMPGLNEVTVSEPVVERMRRCYEQGRGWHLNKFVDEIDNDVDLKTMLQSTEMCIWQARTDIKPSLVPHYFHDWLTDRGKSDFDLQRFGRQELVRWLSSCGIQSAYSFDLSGSESGKTDTVTDKAGRWPWGNHHTNLLGHLEAAAKQWWTYYDPADATTAPTNKVVSEWLIKERKLKKRPAEYIASMLRPDGLPTGPRK